MVDSGKEGGREGGRVGGYNLQVTSTRKDNQEGKNKKGLWEDIRRSFEFGRYQKWVPFYLGF